MSKAPNDKKNLERDVRLRYSVQSGQSTIHGDTNYQVITQEAQSFGFYQSTGQGASEGGVPGTGKHVLSTPGMSMEVLGSGLKVRDAGDISQLPAKIIKAKKGDMIFECENGNILLRAKNVFIDADGGGQDGQLISNMIAYHMQKSLNWSLAAALGGILLAGVLLLYWIYDRVIGIDNMKLG